MQMGGSHQVMLQVKVAEISRDVMRSFDSRFNILGINISDGGTHRTIGGYTAGQGLEPSADAVFSGTRNLVASLLRGDFFFDIAIEASKGNGVAKVLAEPTLTTMSGQEAKFLSGGEFPIPVAQNGGTAGAITIEYKGIWCWHRFRLWC
jgi:pilus assembly protein CpaC